MSSKLCTAVTRDSSWVGLSSLRNTAGASSSPSSFYANFSVASQTNSVPQKNGLTEPSLFHPFHCEHEDRQKFGHYFNKYFNHCRNEFNLGSSIHGEAHQKVVNTFKYFDEGTIAISDTLGHLVDPDIVRRWLGKMK
jgi:hypothetical protein